MEINVVKMQEKHISRISEIEEQCFSVPWSYNQLLEELSNDCAFYFTAEMGKDTVGYIGCHIILDEGYITNVAVDKKYRNMGIGNALVSFLKSFARQNDLSFITLEARASNETAIKLYKKNGFETVGIRRNFYSLPNEDAVLMTLDLKRMNT